VNIATFLNFAEPLHGGSQTFYNRLETIYILSALGIWLTLHMEMSFEMYSGAVVRPKDSHIAVYSTLKERERHITALCNIAYCLYEFPVHYRVVYNGGRLENA